MWVALNNAAEGSGAQMPLPFFIIIFIQAFPLMP
jgi:hypothetical protein